jgi:hypothetical protein
VADLRSAPRLSKPSYRLLPRPRCRLLQLSRQPAERKAALRSVDDPGRPSPETAVSSRLRPTVLMREHHCQRTNKSCRFLLLTKRASDLQPRRQHPTYTVCPDHRHRRLEAVSRGPRAGSSARRLSSDYDCVHVVQGLQLEVAVHAASSLQLSVGGGVLSGHKQQALTHPTRQKLRIRAPRTRRGAVPAGQWPGSRCARTRWWLLTGTAGSLRLRRIVAQLEFRHAVNRQQLKDLDCECATEEEKVA